MRLSFVCALIVSCQILSFCNATAQSTNLPAYQLNETAADVQTVVLGSDSLSSAFLIVVTTEVKSHKHAHHTENVYVIDGEGMMKLGDSTFAIKPGDHVFIPRDTFHSVVVTSTSPLRILSVQSPHFDGTDRIWE